MLQAAVRLTGMFDWVLLCTVLLLFTGRVDAGESSPDNVLVKKLFNFDSGTNGWWTFSKNVKIKLFCDKDNGADTTDGALKITCTTTGSGGYQGAGVQTKWVMGKDKDVWVKYKNGYFSACLKAPSPTWLRIEMRQKGVEAATYAISLKAGKEWRRFDIPFVSFKSSGNPLDLSKAVIDEIVVIPPTSSKGSDLYMDDVFVSTEKLDMEPIDVSVSGTLKTDKGVPVANSEVSLKDISGAFVLQKAVTSSGGKFSLKTTVNSQAYRVNDPNQKKNTPGYDLVVEENGYLKSIYPLVMENKPITCDVALRKASQPLKELKVRKNRIVDADGREVWLQGLCIDSLEWSSTGDFLPRAVIVAADNWKSNAIRLPVHQKYWFGNGPFQYGKFDKYRKRIDDIVKLASEHGAYLILDLHAFGHPTQEHVDFWKDTAQRYKNNPTVLFDLFNEPHSISWEVWQKGGDTSKGVHKDKNVAENNIASSDTMSTGMQSLIDAVRATGAKNIVIAGGLDWGYDLEGVLEGHELNDRGGNGIVYSTHVYPWKTDWQKRFINAAAKYPLFVGEVGCQDTPMPWQKSTEDPKTWAPDMIGVIQKYRLNWTGFSFHPGCGPRIVRNWQYTPTWYWGVYVKEALAGKSYLVKKLR